MSFRHLVLAPLLLLAWPAAIKAASITSWAATYAPAGGVCQGSTHQGSPAAIATLQCPGLDLTARASSVFPVFDAEVFFRNQAPSASVVGASGVAWTSFSGQFSIPGADAAVSAVFRFDLQALNGFLLFEAAGVPSVLRSGDTAAGPIPINLGASFDLSWFALTNGAPVGNGPGWIYGSLLGVDLFTPAGDPYGPGQLIANPEPATWLLVLPALLLLRRRVSR